MNPDPTSLQRVGVTVIDARRFRLHCDACGETWRPRVPAGGDWPRNWWHCPSGCSTEARADAA